MRAQIAICLVISISLTVSADELPEWISSGATKDASGAALVVCSHEALDPEDAKQLAEDKCLTAAAKSQGVTLVVRDQITTSLSGSDSHEVAEIQPIQAKVRCEWTKRFVEPLQSGFRVWLECRVVELTAKSIKGARPIPAHAIALPYARAILTISSVPQPDIILVVGLNGERAVEVKSNVQSVTLQEGDSAIILRKLGYVDAKKPLVDWKNGYSLAMDFTLEREP